MQTTAQKKACTWHGRHYLLAPAIIADVWNLGKYVYLSGVYCNKPRSISQKPRSKQTKSHTLRANNPWFPENATVHVFRPIRLIPNS